MLDATTAYILSIIFIATLIRSTFGFGEALVAVPLLALKIPINVAAPLTVLVSIVVAGVIVVQDWRKVELRSALGLIFSALFGIPLGVLFLTKANDRAIKLVLGIIIVTFSVYSLAAKSKSPLHPDRWGWLLGCGFISGILGGAYGMNGPPLVIYGGLRRWSPQHFRATLQGYFLMMSPLGLIGYAAVRLWDAKVTHYFLLSLPGVCIAVLIGRWLNHRMRGHHFFRMVYLGLVAIGIVLLVQALSR